MKTIYNSIREEVEKHLKVRNSVLGNVSEWKRSHYIILSEIIKDELSDSEELKGGKKFEIGNTISHVTLQRFFENDYQDKTHNDLRFLKTLDKICIFLGYKDLNDYIQSVKLKNREKELDDDLEFLTKMVYDYCATAFEFYKHFPEHKPEFFKKLVFDDSPFLERTSQFSKELCERDFNLVTKNNRSNYEVFDIHVVTDEPEKKILETQEFWNLLFKVGENGEEHFVNQLNTQIYFIRKIDNVWKIWDNYNPDAGILNRKVDR
ncbi:hypothetical protein EG346_00740 [Chryseobacterium carnipullorum]|uniref:Uncharacterized protein n=1 Tax=Chryseobacterium carnipullorum TaxID=1124835 RepID=A0A376EB59_CHRCU|nr:hypothetical protein [Chryseobacterium carnipullorum]AZA46831.1 hypothetical protein EG346_00740 [Chryseobacterium carnipullorum]AZA66191.1 hypothetical protein EG345_16825 [Chryseobacterium carnipullorum]STD06187.1 Uncharacterised protein [Chryseobacterium carnipullorum]